MKRFVVLLSFIVLSVGTNSTARAIDTPGALLSAAASSAPLTKKETEKEAAKSEKAAEEKEAKPDKDSEKPAKDEAETAKDSGEKESGEKEKKTTDSSEKEKSASKSDAKASKPEAKKPKTDKVEEKRLKVEIPIEGVFVATDMSEVPLRPEAWTSFEIEEVAEHGQKVREGATLIKFDDDDINKAISDLELDQRLSELAIRKTEEELPRMEKSLKMDLDDADRSNHEAQEDFERYNEIERPQSVKSAEFMVKYYNFMLDYEKDELDQLEKMYAADDLTEETEEVVLKRQRNSVEFAEYSLENAKLRRDETLKVILPRYDVAIKESLDRAEMALARAKTAWALDLNRARYELEQRKQARDKSLERHAKLLADRGLMELKSPVDGIVFYGQCVNGRWTEAPSLINKYKPHGNVTPGSVVMTIVKSRPMYITASVDEAKRPEVAAGQTATITLPAESAARLTATVKSISPIPVGPGKFDVRLELSADEIPDWVAPGITCKISVKSYDKKDALVVPKAAIHDDEDDPNKQYVLLVKPDDQDAKPERRTVTVGKRSGDDVEIVKGLKAGDVVSLDDEAKKTDE